MAQAMAARPDRCLGNFPLPPFNATRPSSVPSPSQLASSRSRQRLSAPPRPRARARHDFTEHYLFAPYPFRQTKSQIAARRRTARSPLRVCLQWRCATPIILGVLHLRIDCIVAAGGAATTATAMTITKKRNGPRINISKLNRNLRLLRKYPPRILDSFRSL